MKLNVPSGRLMVVGLDFVDELAQGAFVEDPSVVAQLGTVTASEFWGIWATGICGQCTLLARRENAKQPWERLDVVVANGAVQQRHKVGEVLSDHGALAIFDPSILPTCNACTVEIADVVCWGSHAGKVAKKLGLEQLSSGIFGFRDVSLADAEKSYASIMRSKRFWYGLRAEIKPHTLAYQLERALNGKDIGLLTHRGHEVLVIAVHQDGSWPVEAGVDSAGSLVELGVDFTLSNGDADKVV